MVPSAGKHSSKPKKTHLTEMQQHLAESTRTSQVSRNTSAYDNNFVTVLGDSVGFPEARYYPGHTPLPNAERLDELKAERLKSRNSMIFLDDEFIEMIENADTASDEGDVSDKVISKMRGNDTYLFPKQNMRCTNLAPLIEKKELVVMQPDLSDGAQLHQIDRNVRADLGHYIQPSTKADLPALPNFFLEFKGPAGNSQILKRQAFYDGCIGARGIHQLRSYGKDPSTMYDDKIYTITSTYFYGVLTIYGVWPTSQIDRKRQGDTSYHMTEIGRWYLINPEDKDQSIRGVTAFRNLRDWAKKQRDDLIMQINHSVASSVDSPTMQRSLSSNNEIETPSDTDFDIYENENFVEPTEKRDLPKGQSSLNSDGEDEEEEEEEEEEEDQQQHLRSRPHAPRHSSSTQSHTHQEIDVNIESTKRRNLSSSPDELANSPSKATGKRSRKGNGHSVSPEPFV